MRPSFDLIMSHLRHHIAECEMLCIFVDLSAPAKTDRFIIGGRIDHGNTVHQLRSQHQCGITLVEMLSAVSLGEHIQKSGGFLQRCNCIICKSKFFENEKRWNE